MSQAFKSHIEKFIKITEEEFSDILSFFEEKDVKKKGNLLVAGKVCRHHYFVLNGCLRMFFVNDKGVEQTTDFAIESWWMTDNMAYERHSAASFFIQAVERSKVLCIDYASQEKLVAVHPIMERYFRYVYQRAFAASQMRIKYLYDFTKEEMFLHLDEHYPQFVQRVPQQLIASFLGFTPEYLSEIRKKIRS